MKVLSILSQKPYATGSGMYMTELMKALDKLGVEQAAIYACDDEERPNHGYWKPMDIQNLKEYPVHFNSKELPFDIFGMSDVMPYKSSIYSKMTEEQLKAYERAFLGKMQEAAAEFSPDLVIAHHLYLSTAIFEENFKNFKLCAVCHGTDLRQIKSHAGQRGRIISSIQKIGRIFALQNEQAKDISTWFKMDKSKITVVGSGLNSDIFHIKDPNSTNGLEEIRLVFAGKITKSKGIYSLINAINRIEDYSLRLSLAGSSGTKAEYKEIKAHAEKSRHKIEFLGHLNQQELSELFNKADIFVQPSYYEGLSMVCLEAAACGLPVVTSNTAGLQEFISDKLDRHHFVFINLPLMESVDKPVEEELPRYEEDLAQGIMEQIEILKEEKLCKAYLTKELFSWEKIAKTILREGMQVNEDNH